MTLTAEKWDEIACVMCGDDNAVTYTRIGSRWLCRPDTERLAWHVTELAGVAELCGLTLDQLRGVLTR